MNLRDVDLNLLVILDALLEEAHVSRAAARLGLSQPAASNALGRARTLFGDPLLVRTGTGLRRTPAAERLRGPLREALAWVGHVVDPTPPDLKRLRQTVRVAMGDHAAAVVAGPLVERVRQSAPGIDLVVHPAAGDSVDALRRGAIDLATAAAAPSGKELKVTPLATFAPQVIMRRRHPAVADFTFDRWLDFPHILVSGDGETSDAVDGVLARDGRTRRVAATVPGYLLALQIVSESDMFALLPAELIPGRLAANLVAADPPIAIEPQPLFLLRHPRSDGDVAVAHVATLFGELFGTQS